MEVKGLRLKALSLFECDILDKNMEDNDDDDNDVPNT
jgi:hypothetical protein